MVSFQLRDGIEAASSQEQAEGNQTEESRQRMALSLAAAGVGKSGEDFRKRKRGQERGHLSKRAKQRRPPLLISAAQAKIKHGTALGPGRTVGYSGEIQEGNQHLRHHDEELDIPPMVLSPGRRADRPDGPTQRKTLGNSMRRRAVKRRAPLSSG
jgi:hypothetical protein